MKWVYLQRKKLYSELNDCGILDEHYEHTQMVWKEFNMKMMGDYHNHYLQRDVLLLADVFEEFRSACLESYSLDPHVMLYWKCLNKKLNYSLI